MRRFSSSRYLEELMAELDRAAISARLQQSRKTSGISQDEMAEILKVHVNSIQNWERMRVPTIPFDRLDEWAAVTDTSKAWLLHGVEASQPAADAEVVARLDAVESLLQELLRRLPGAQDEPGEAASG